jgi:3-keto-5-aminohexanoate cleavage enzyme
MATLTCGTVNFGDDVFSNPLPAIREIARRILALGIKPEIEAFDAGHLDTAKHLSKRGELPALLHVDFVLGVPGAMAATERNLRFLADSVPEGWTWCVAGIGRHELPMAKLAIEWGGHVRVGLEDNIYLAKDVLAEGNAPLVAKVVEMAKSARRAVATIAEARQILRL